MVSIELVASSLTTLNASSEYLPVHLRSNPYANAPGNWGTVQVDSELKKNQGANWALSLKSTSKPKNRILKTLNPNPKP